MLKDKLLQRYVGAIAALAIISLLSSWTGVSSLHEISNSWDGFLWGMADPVLALDKFASILAIGLLAAGNVRGRLIATTLIFANICGTLIYLWQINLPVTEIAIAIISIVLGIVLITSKQPNLWKLLIITAIAGLLQGYFNSESIIGAETMPSVMYIFGAALTQYAVVMSSREIATQVSQADLSGIWSRKISLVGFAICALGIVFLKNWSNL
ncbi:HupE/UreJ family protein [Nostoc sp. LEGE 06077]|uniref:HupE/UreJ family protein n=1 Tax=Nostoc sp. LEGE 06077 TaxID=915325 RepID=UPI0018816EE0|nr:HupE/UreJ family protein [Nostoc sp. LEGE 06077]MBE9210781.1 HupE/UreJ family protein [Nostoc sp. LEGE 06077]